MKVPFKNCCEVLLGLCFAFACVATAAEPGSVTALIEQLPATGTSEPIKMEVMKSLIQLGDDAVPALEKELRPRIRFKELNVLLQQRQSKRLAAAEVLIQIPTARSTELLVDTLADPTDNYGMQVIILDALRSRSLEDPQIVRLLGNSQPEVVQAGIALAKSRLDSQQVVQGLEKVFDLKQIELQMRNEFDKPTANEQAIWSLRLMAGRTLGKDLQGEIQSRTQAMLAVLKAEAMNPTEPDKPLAFSLCSKSENQILQALRELEMLGEPARQILEQERNRSKENYGKLIAMALVYVGDRSLIPAVAAELSESKSPTIRFCAASTLRKIKDRAAIPALRIGLRDSYQREDGSCCFDPKSPLIHPIRMIAADALIDLGEDSKVVREQVKSN